MKRLANKRIILGITGGIAAYKACELTRTLVKHGATVRVVMSKGAVEFITPLTLQALSGNPVHTSLLDPAAEAGMGHIELAKWADLIIIAPASANALSRLATGMSDDLLTTLCLASQAPIAIAPAMNQAMWQDGATQQNVATLQALKGEKLMIWGPDQGEQACGDVGPGRMLEPQILAQYASECFETETLTGVSVVITAGPTREAIDPVRYISNHSSGKMGYALAQAAQEAGAKVTLISGPTQLEAPERVNKHDVTSCDQMLEASVNQLPCDIFIATAAVADYRPKTIHNQKMKKSGDSLQLELIPNPDIVSHIANHPKRPFTVGFAAETNDVIEYAKGKLERKKLDMIIANDVSNSAIGFNSDDNQVVVIDAVSEHPLPLLSKSLLAKELIEKIAKRYHAGLNLH